MLKSVELSGFKSFAKKTVLEIDAPAVAIVGPNGSGKSNATEAFRFVLGEQSIKSMRGKRGEDLIWAGTDMVPRANRASVRVHFNNSARLLDIDFDEVVIERTVHRDGANEYFINDTRVRLKDITTLLAGANIGGSGHHIISQGEADKILNAGVGARREILEDALGLKVFQYKKVESERKLTKTQKNVKEVEIARRELAPHLKFLSRQMKKRERAVSLREELKNALALYLARENVFIKKESKRLGELKSVPARELAELEQKLEQLKKAEEDTNITAEEEDAELLREIASLDEDAGALATKRGMLTRELGRLEGQIALLNDVGTYANQNVSMSGESVAWHDVERFTNEIITETQVAEKSREPEVLRGSLRHIRVSAEEFGRAREARAPTQAPNNTEQISELKSKKEQIEAELKEVSQKEQELGSRHRELAKELEYVQSQSKYTQLKVLELSAKRSELKSILRDIERDETALARTKTGFNEELREAVALLGRSVQDFEYVNQDEIGEIDRSTQEVDRRAIERMKIKLEEIGVVGEDVVEEYKNTLERDEFLARELQDLNNSHESLLGLINELEEELKTRFKNGLTKVNEEFQNFFSALFGGGKAELRLVQSKGRRSASDLLTGLGEEEETEVEDGVEVQVRLPRKRVSTLEVLSGGERALTSIALIFAMSQVNPPPFLILDETDAALDEANSKRYADMVRVLSEKSQLILITHNRETMAAAGELYGVTMGADGVSRLLSVKLDEAVAVAK